MSLASVIGKIFGSKAERDYKAVKPILDRILAVYPEIDALSADGLRARSAALRRLRSRAVSRKSAPNLTRTFRCPRR